MKLKQLVLLSTSDDMRHLDRMGIVCDSLGFVVE
jgi:hypothetical protein